MIEQGGVKVNGEKVSDKALQLARRRDLRAAGRQAQVRQGDAAQGRADPGKSRRIALPAWSRNCV